MRSGIPTARSFPHSNRNGSYQIWQIHPDGSGLRQVTNLPGEIFLPFPSPDNSLLAASSSTEPSRLVDLSLPWPITEATVLPQPDGGEEPFRPLAWSPDGARIAGSLGNSPQAKAILVYSLATGTYEKVLELESEFLAAAIFLDDGRRLLLRVESGLVILDTTSGEMRRVAGSPNLRSPWISFSPDDRLVYYTEIKKESDIWLGRSPE